MSFTRSLACMCFMTVLLQYTCNAACVPLESTRNQAPGNQAPTQCETLLSTAELSSLRMQIRRKLRSISTQMNETFRDIFADHFPSSIGLYTNRMFSSTSRDGSRQNQSVAESVRYFRCFICPMADALKNETIRNITEREPSYFSQFYITYGNLSIATDIYNLVKGDPNMYQCLVPGLDVSCDFQLTEAPGNYTVRQHWIGAIAKELHYLALDLLELTYGWI